MAKKLRCGVVGLNMGKAHAQCYQELADAELVALCDNNSEVLKSVAGELGIKQTFTDFQEMLEQVELDAVSVTVPHRLHAPFTIAALEAGVHVLCTKPMAADLAGAEAMLEAQRRTGKTLIIGFQLPLTPQAQRARQMIGDGDLGDIYYAKMGFLRQKSEGMPDNFLRKSLAVGGPLLDLGIHLIDYAMFVLGDPQPRSIRCFTSDKLMRAQRGEEDVVEDFALASIFLEQTCVLVETSFAIHSVGDTITDRWFHGTKAALCHKGDNSLLLVSGDQVDKIEIEQDVPVSQALSVNHFIDVLLGRTEPICTPERGLFIQRIIATAYDSAAQGKEIAWPYG